MEFVLNGNETADQLIKQLVALRLHARLVIKAIDVDRRSRTFFERHRENAADGDMKAAAMQALARIDERELMLKSTEIEIGQYLMPLSDALDRKATREQIFEAINTNPADRDTDMVRKYGDKAIHLICTLHLENSATNRHEDCASRESQPLHWCHTMAFMRALQTSPKLDRIVHDGANEFFNGIFGEYRERPLMERLAGRAV